MRFLVIIALLGVILVSGVVVSTSYDGATAHESHQEAAGQQDTGAEDVACASPVASPEASPHPALALTPIASPMASPTACGQPGT